MSRTATPRIGLDVENRRIRQRLQTIFTELRLVPNPREAPGSYSAVFFEVSDEGCLPFLRRWIKRGTPTILVAGRGNDELFRQASELGASDGLLMPLDYIQTRLALQHVLSSERPDHRFPLPTLNLAHLERMAIDEALRRTGRSFADAAQLLGVGRSTLYRRVPELFPKEG
jgi:DNA-binding NtrC family response regulator